MNDEAPTAPVGAERDLREAEALFVRGNYRQARTRYATIAIAELTAEQQALVRARLGALSIDPVALYYGVGSLVFIVVAYLLGRFVLGS